MLEYWRQQPKGHETTIKHLEIEVKYLEVQVEALKMYIHKKKVERKQEEYLKRKEAKNVQPQ